MLNQDQRAFICPPPRLCLGVLEQHDRHHQHDQQDDRDRRGHGPVAVVEELDPERLADHQRAGAAKQVGNDELAHGRNEHQQAAGQNARHGEPRGHLPEGADAGAAEIARGLDQRFIHLLERRIDRQHHEGQVGIDDADIDRGVGRQDLERRVDDTEPEQELVEQPLLLEDADPGVDADQERGPERQDHQHQQRRAQPSGARAMP
jgi:hypothetical protein